MQNLRFILILISVSLLSPSIYAQAPDFKSERSVVQTLDQMLYDHDQAAWHATDKLLLDMKKNGDIAALRGWITVPDGRNVVVKFIAETEDGPVSAWEAKVRGSKVRSYKRVKMPELLSESDLELWRARSAVDLDRSKVCAQYLPMNSVVFRVPGDLENRIYVYYLASTKQAGEVVLGRHFRYLVSADGRQILETKEFTNTCFAIDAGKSRKDVPKGAKTVGLTASHLKAPYPEETHIFANLTHKIDLFVMTTENGKMWTVKNGRIREIKDK